MAELLLVMMQGAGGIGKLAVLKRIWPELAADPHILTMFQDEARLSVRMTHPNVVQTYEVFDDEGRTTLAMEYLDGQPLIRILNRMRGAQGLSLPLRLRIAEQALAGLHYAHELRDYDGTPLSVVHRDVNPSNVFLTYEGGVKLIDFGIAKNLANAHQTRPGIFKGKFSYVPPEQFMGRPIDRRADIFALGIMLWEMLAGRRFWGSASDAEIAARLIASQPLPALPADPALPAGLDAICARALQRDCAQRYATAAEMQADLRRVLTGLSAADDRMLGMALESSFAGERAQRHVLIDQFVRRARSGTYPTPSSGSLPRPIVAPAREAPRLTPLRAAAMGATVMGLVVALMASWLHRTAPPDVPAGPAAEAVGPARRPPSEGSGPSAEIPAQVERIFIREGAPPTGRASDPPAPAPALSPATAARHRRIRPIAPNPVAPAAAPAPAPAHLMSPPLRLPRPIETQNPFLPSDSDPDAGAP